MTADLPTPPPTLILDGTEFRRIQQYDRTYWCLTHHGTEQWFDNTDETVKPYRHLAAALDRITDLETEVDRRRRFTEAIGEVSQRRAARITELEAEVADLNGVIRIMGGVDDDR